MLYEQSGKKLDLVKSFQKKDQNLEAQKGGLGLLLASYTLFFKDYSLGRVQTASLGRRDEWKRLRTKQQNQIRNQAKQKT
jgi:hypothetical protein